MLLSTGLGAKIISWVLGRGSKYVLAFILLSGVFGYGYVKGAEITANKYDAINSANQKVIFERFTKALANSAKTETELRAKILRVRSRTIVKEVPRYINIESDRACALPNGFVRLHDAAAAAILPPSPANSDGDSSGVALSAATGVITENYATCHELRARLIAWQNWVLENHLNEAR